MGEVDPTQKVIEIDIKNTVIETVEAAAGATALTSEASLNGEYVPPQYATLIPWDNSRMGRTEGAPFTGRGL